MRRAEVLIVVGIVLIAAGLLFSALEKMQRCSRIEESRNHLKQLMICVSSYKDAQRCYPSAASVDKNEQQLLSWRVLTLPFLESSPLYMQFKQAEPWDSPENIPLLVSDGTHFFFDATMGYGEPGMAYYQVFVGPGTAFEPSTKPKKFFPWTRGLVDADFPNGPANTLFIVEARDPVPWTKPQDLPFVPKQPLPPLGLQYDKRLLWGTYLYKSPTFLAAFGGGDVRSLSVDMDEGALSKLIDRNSTD